AISHLRDDILDKDTELCALLLRIASPVTHDDAAIAQINQAAEIVHNVRLGTCASITAAACANPGFPDVNKELMAQAEGRQASSLRLAQLLERAETRTKVFRAQPGGQPPISDPGCSLQCCIGGATNQDGWMRTLHRPRAGDDRIKLIVLTLKRHLATCAYALDNLD